MVSSMHGVSSWSSSMSDQHDELVSPPKAHALRVVGLLGSGQFASVWRVDDGTPFGFTRHAGGSSNEHR